jgi:hypothetical protein
MRFVATHNVTLDDLTHAVQLTRRWTDLLVGMVVVVVLAAVLSQVLYAFSLYLRAATDSPDRLVALLRFEGGPADAALAWTSVLVTLCLPVFLFYSVRALAETMRPAWRARRLMRDSDLCGAITYAIDDHGVRSTKEGGSDVFIPWSAFDGVRNDTEIVVLLRRTQMLFFVPLRAFGADRGVVLAQLRSHISASGS